jgi:hypothetical protein
MGCKYIHSISSQKVNPPWRAKVKRQNRKETELLQAFFGF